MADSNAKSRRGDENRYLVARTRSYAVALPLGKVVETMRPLPIRPVAETPEFLLGLSVIRGAPTPVVDLESFLTGRPGKYNRFVTLTTRRTQQGRRVALALRSVDGVETISAGAASEKPKLTESARSDAVERLAALDGELALIFDSSKVISAETWQKLEEHRQK
jgi:purine-binding chemotaxis protein CheW